MKTILKNYKAKKKEEHKDDYQLNNIKSSTNVIFTLIFTILALCCAIPLVFIVIISISSEQSLIQNGYSFFPKEISFDAYGYIFRESEQVMASYMVTVIVTILGTFVGVVLNSTFAYVLSRKEYKYNKVLTVILLIPMLFNGGMVSLYIVVTQVLGLKDTIWALILPMAVSPFYIIVLRTFFKMTVPDSIVESAKLDGASQLKIFAQIVLPISLPGMATVGLFLLFAYWGDYYHGLLFIQEKSLIPIQTLLMRIETSLKLIQQNQHTSGLSVTSIAMKLPQESIRMAMVVIVAVPIVCTYPFFQKYFISGLTIGSVKG